jgi:hypothetical protein
MRETQSTKKYEEENVARKKAVCDQIEKACSGMK